MNIAAVIQRNQHRTSAAHAKSAGAGASFAAAMASAQNDAPAADPAGKGGHGSTAAAPVQTPGSVRLAGPYEKFVGRSTGTGQCVALVRATNPAIGSTSCWVRGASVQGNANLQPGTPIATFAPSGHYANATDGSSHSAVYLGQTAQGVQVLDQWAGRPAAVRTIPWQNPGAAAANTGGAFHVVNSVQTPSV